MTPTERAENLFQLQPAPGGAWLLYDYGRTDEWRWNFGSKAEAIAFRAQLAAPIAAAIEAAERDARAPLRKLEWCVAHERRAVRMVTPKALKAWLEREGWEPDARLREIRYKHRARDRHVTVLVDRKDPQFVSSVVDAINAVTAGTERVFLQALVDVLPDAGPWSAP